MNAEVVASLTTAVGMLVLAVATFQSTRSANRASRVPERSMLSGLRPVLMNARMDDPAQKIGFMDQRWYRVEGSGAVFDVGDDTWISAVARQWMLDGVSPR